MRRRCQTQWLLDQSSPAVKNRIHETDEFITVDELMKDAGMITRAMCELAGSAER